MLSRLPISLAQLKAGNNSESLKTKLDNYCILYTDQKNLESNSIKVWLVFFLNIETIFMKNKNSKTSESCRFRLDLTDNPDLKDPKKNMSLANLSIYYTWKNIKSEYSNNKYKVFVPTSNDTFDLPGGSYSITLNLSSKNTKCWIKILQCKLTLTKIKTEKIYQSWNLLKLF